MSLLAAPAQLGLFGVALGFFPPFQRRKSFSLLCSKALRVFPRTELWLMPCPPASLFQEEVFLEHSDDSICYDLWCICSCQVSCPHPHISRGSVRMGMSSTVCPRQRGIKHRLSPLQTCSPVGKNVSLTQIPTPPPTINFS